MKIQFIKQCGHRKEGSVMEAEHLAANQYIASGFAVAYVAPPVEQPAPPVEPKPEPEKNVSKERPHQTKG